MLLAGLVLAGAASEPIALAGKPGPKSKCTVKGTAGADKLRGRPGRDVICARGGNDRVVALGGPDQLLGGPGNDELHGDAATTISLAARATTPSMVGTVAIRALPPAPSRARTCASTTSRSSR